MHWVGVYANSFTIYIWNAFVAPYKAGFSVHVGGNVHVWAKLTLLLENLLIEKHNNEVTGQTEQHIKLQKNSGFLGKKFRYLCLLVCFCPMPVLTIKQI